MLSCWECLMSPQQTTVRVGGMSLRWGIEHQQCFTLICGMATTTTFGGRNLHPFNSPA